MRWGYGLLVVHWRRGIVLAGLVMLTQLLSLVGHYAQWLGNWSDLDAVSSSGLILVVPVIVAGSAWIRSSNRTSGLTAMAESGKRSPLVMRARIQVETFSWCGVGYIAAILLGGVAVSRYASFGTPQILPVLPQLAMVFLATAIGLAVGRDWPALIVVPVAAVSTYLLITVGFIEGGDSIERLTPIEGRAMGYFVVSPVVHVATTFWLVLLGAGLTCLLAGRLRLTVTCMWLAGIAVAPVLLIGSADLTMDVEAAEPACSPPGSAGFVVCLPRATSFNAGRLQAGYSRLADQVGVLLPTTTAFVSDDAAGYDAGIDMAIRARRRDVVRQDYELLPRDAYYTGGDAWLSGQEFLLRMITYVIPPQATSTLPANGSGPSAPPNVYLQRWLMTQLGFPIDGSAGLDAPVVAESFYSYAAHSSEIAWFQSLTERQRDGWFSAHRNEIAGATLEWAEFE